MVTAEQLRAARAMSRLEQATLAEIAGISVETVRRIEGQKGELRWTDGVTKIHEAYKIIGIEFLDEPCAGVRWAMDKKAALKEMILECIRGTAYGILEAETKNSPAFLDQDIDTVVDKILAGMPKLVKHELRHRLPKGSSKIPK